MALSLTWVTASQMLPRPGQCDGLDRLVCPADAQDPFTPPPPAQPWLEEVAALVPDLSLSGAVAGVCA